MVKVDKFMDWLHMSVDRPLPYPHFALRLAETLIF